MNKKIMVAGIVAAVVVAAGAAAYFLLPQDEVTVARRALQGNGSATCTFVDPETQDEGTLYARSGDLRITTVAHAEGEETIDAHFLVKGDVGYMWADNESQGIQMVIEEEDDGVEASLRDMDEDEFAQEFERSQFSCKRGADRAMFDVPGDIEFMDMSDFTTDAFMPEDETNEQSAEAQAELERALQELEQGL